MDDNKVAIVTVTVPSDAAEGDSAVVTVTATSRGDPTKSDSASYTATATTAPPPSRDLLPITVGGVVAVAVIAVLSTKGIIHLPSIHSRFLRLPLPNQ